MDLFLVIAVPCLIAAVILAWIRRAEDPFADGGWGIAKQLILFTCLLFVSFLVYVGVLGSAVSDGGGVVLGFILIGLFTSGIIIPITLGGFVGYLGLAYLCTRILKGM